MSEASLEVLRASSYLFVPERDPRLSENGSDPSDVVELHSWTPVDLLAIEKTRPGPPEILGLFYRRRLHIVTGEPESAKSWLALVACVEEIRAGNTVLYVDLEMGESDVLSRLRDLGLSDEEIRDRFVYIGPREPLDEAAIQADVAATIDTRRPTLVVIDSQNAALELHGLDPDKGKDVQHFYRAYVARYFERSGAAVIALDHVVKKKNDRGRWAAGSERKIGVVTGSGFSLEAVHPFGRGRTGLVRLTTSRDRPGYLPRPRAGELELVSDPASGRITWTLRLAEHQHGDHEDGPAFRPTVLMERVSRYLELHHGSPASRAEIETAVTGKRDYIRLAVNVLVSEGYARESDGPRGARLVESVQAYRDDDLAPTSPPHDEHDLAPTSPRPESHNQAEHATSPHLAPISPLAPESTSPQLALSPTGGASWRGEVGDVSEDEIDRLREKHTDLAQPALADDDASRARAHDEAASDVPRSEDDARERDEERGREDEP